MRGPGQLGSCDGDSVTHCSKYVNKALPFIRLQAFFLTSPMFERSNVTRHLLFANNMNGEAMGSLRLESLGSSRWTTFWLQAGDRGPLWESYKVVIPQDAKMLRFVGITGSSWTSDIALDAIGVGVGVPVLDLEYIACAFTFHTCKWVSTGNVSWQASGGWLEADGNNASDGQVFIIESPMLNVTTEKVVVFSYMMTGSSSVSLEVEHKTEFAVWSTLFVESGDTGNTWKAASIRVPEGTVGLRLLANLSAWEKAKVGVVSVADVVSSFANLTCSFEVDHCGWSSVFGVWQRFGGPQPASASPDAAFRSDFYMATSIADGGRTLQAGMNGDVTLEAGPEQARLCVQIALRR